MKKKKLFTMEQVIDLTYAAMMYGRRSKFTLNEAKSTHKSFLDSVFASKKTDNVTK